MKKTTIILTAAFSFVLVLMTGNMFAQEKVHIKMKKNVDGVETIMDTTFTVEEGDDVHQIIHGWEGMEGVGEIDVNVEVEGGESGQKRKKVIIMGDHDDIDDPEIQRMIKEAEGSLEEELEVESDGKEVKVRKVIIHKGEGEEGDHKTEEHKWIMKGDEIDDAKMQEIQQMIKEHGGEGKVIMLKKDGEGDMDIDVDELLKQEGIEMEVDDDVRIIMKHKDESEEEVGKKYVRTIKIVVKLEELTEEDKQTLERSGVDQETLENDLELEQLSFYPNPSNGQFNLSFTSNEGGDASVRIMDAQGKVVYTEELPGLDGQYEKAIDISGEASGIYFLSVMHGGKVLTQKVVLE